MQVDKFDQLMHFGYINQHENDLDSAYFCFDEALKFANSEQERTEANVCMASTLVMEGDFQSALDLLLSITVSDSISVITINSLIANCHHSLNQFAEAKTAYLTAISTSSHLAPGNWISEQIATNYLQLLDDERRLANQPHAISKIAPLATQQCA
jgi:lipopolysaccharide biosynthesis regulator YciM